MAADFSAPSFSLGHEFDLVDSEHHFSIANIDYKARSASNKLSISGSILIDDDDDLETITVIDSDSGNECSLSPKLKRMCGGSSVGYNVPSAMDTREVDLRYVMVVDDDIFEDVSSPEENRTDEHFSAQHHSVCKSSKFPYSGHVALSKQSGNRKQNVSNAPESVVTTCNKLPFQKPPVSPLRRIQLIDSDSDCDDPYISSGATKNMYNGVCEECLCSMKDKLISQSNVGKNNQNIHDKNSVIIDLGDPRPPALQYFFNNDTRVQDLVRTRLPYFFPLNTDDRFSDQASTSNIDYMGQFRCDERPSEKRVPKDAAKRRVQADGQSADASVGHWFTNQDGKRAYVSKNGQELTGRAAYALYKMESEAGF